MPKKITDIRAAYDERAIKTGNDKCWRWKGAVCGGGYGLIGFRRNGKATHVRAHRLSYELHKGKIPSQLHVLHKCDNKICSNPSHLYLGTQKQNAKDAMERNLLSKGTQRYNAILDEKKVKYIRKNYVPFSKENNLYSLARKFKCSYVTIGDVIRGQTWKHVKEIL
jgi:hypothetical protein